MIGFAHQEALVERMRAETDAQLAAEVLPDNANLLGLLTVAGYLRQENPLAGQLPAALYIDRHDDSQDCDVELFAEGTDGLNQRVVRGISYDSVHATLLRLFEYLPTSFSQESGQIVETTSGNRFFIVKHDGIFDSYVKYGRYKNLGNAMSVESDRLGLNGLARINDFTYPRHHKTGGLNLTAALREAQKWAHFTHEPLWDPDKHELYTRKLTREEAALCLKDTAN